MVTRITWMHILLFFAILKLTMHLTTNTLWSLHRDELLYLALGRHLDWGYASVPPSIGIFSWIADRIFGGSVFAIRLIPSLISTATVVLTGMMAYQMSSSIHSPSRGQLAAVLVGFAGLTSGAFLRPGMLFQPVVFDIFYWTLLSYVIIKYVNTEDRKWLFWLGLITGLGLLNKYSVAFLIVGLLPWLLFSAHRSLFFKKDFYLLIGIAFLVFLPNLIWQLKHDLPVIRHLTELAATQFVNVTSAGFFMDQFFFFLPAIPLWLLGIYYLLFDQTGKKWKGFAWMYFSVLLLLWVLKGKSYYTIGAYPVLIAAGAAYLDKLSIQKIWIPVGLVLLMLIIAIPRFPIILPIYHPKKEVAFFEKRKDNAVIQSALRWEDGTLHSLPQDFADMLGWKEIAEMTAKAWQTIENKNTAAIYAESYGLAGAIEYFGKKHQLPDVLSFSDNYRYWLPDSLASDFKTLIYVHDELGDDMPEFFSDLHLFTQLDMPMSRQHGTKIYICQHPTPAFFDRISQAIANAKNELPID